MAWLAVTLGCSGNSAGVGDGTGGTGSGSGSGASGGAASSGGSSGAAPGADALFDAPSSDATPGSIYGVWGGLAEDSGVTFDTRMKLSSRSVTLATRCQLRDGHRSRIVAVTVAARVTDDLLSILESESDDEDDGVIRCAVRAAPRDLPLCSTEPFAGLKRNCFELQGSRLTQYGDSPLDKLELTKLSD